MGKKSRREREREDNRGVGREERVIIVDINETGDGVVGVNSLSKDWQVLVASIENALTWDGGAENNAGDEEGGRGLMLRIEGVGVDVLDGEVGLGGGKRKEGERGLGESGVGSGIGEEEMHALLDGFDKKMSVLRRIMGSRESLRSVAGIGESNQKGQGQGEGGAEG
jgi:hypothetical protein